MAATHPFQPLTTVFTPPASCVSSVFYDQSRGSYVIAPIELPGCFPSTSTPLQSLTYSPGICPSGWTLAAEVVSCYTITTPTFSIATETEIACCPDALAFDPDGLSRCKAIIDQATSSTPTVLSSVYPWPDQASPRSASATPTASALPTGSTTVPSSLGLLANKTKSTHFLFENGTQSVWSPMLFVRYQATDTAVVSYWSSVFARAAGTATTSPPADPIPSTPTHNHLTGWEMIGLIFGSVATFGILVGGLTLFFVRRKIVRRFQKSRISNEDEKLDLKAELDDTAKQAAVLGSAEVLEKEAPVIQPVELLADVPLFEL